MNIIELAKQAGLHIATDVNWMPIISLEYAEKFAALVEAEARADEREAIARMFEDAPVLVQFAQNDLGGCLVCGFTPKLVIKVIRARETT